MNNEFTSENIEQRIREEKEELSLAVDMFCDAMKKRLFKKVDDGFFGWSDPYFIAGMHSRILSKSTSIVVDKDIEKNAVDIANFSMMIFMNEKFKQAQSHLEQV